MKRLISLLLSLALILSMVPLAGAAGDGITWTLSDEGVLELSGTGAMSDYKYAKAPWYPNRDSIRRIVVGSGITALGDHAFASCKQVTEVSLPAGLERIGASAFYLCERLTEIAIPEGVTELGNNAFASCTRLAQATLPGSLRTIGIGAFYKCNALTEMTIPEGVTSLGRECFSECFDLETISLPSTLTEIGERAFERCLALKSITVAENSAAFSHDSQGALYNLDKTQLLRVPGGFRGEFVIPDTVTAVEELAAHYCTGLTAVTIPKSVKEIGGYAFSYCALTQATVPDSVTVIPEGCFFYNENLASVTIPETVTEVNGSAFGYCEALTEIDLPDGLTVLGNGAFWGCWQLKSIVIPEGITELESSIFYNCTNLKTVQLPSRLQSIDYWCFQFCSSLTDLVLPDTLQSIGANAFEGCHSLTSIVFPASLNYLAAYSFKNSGLTEMTFLGNVPTFNLGLGIAEHAFGGVTAIAYYPRNNPTWTEEVRQDYSGDLTWVPHDLHSHTWAEATCTEPKTCLSCGATEGEALGHNYVDYECTRCYRLAPLPFEDVQYGAFCHVPIAWAVEHGITRGITPTTFCPNRTCTRSQVVTFLWRAAGGPEPRSADHPFTDVDETAFYYDAMLWAVENGITSGMSATTFAPDGECTRGQVVTFLHRAKGEPAAASSEHPFTDVREGAFYYDAMLWAMENKITNGTGRRTFAPGDACTRGQVVTFLYRTFA